MFDERESGTIAGREPLRQDFPTVLEQIERDKHNGPITFHFLDGRPVMVDFPQEPQRIRLERRNP